MKREYKITIVAVFFTVMLILGGNIPDNFSNDSLEYTWKEMDDGLWKRIELTCGSALDYMCVSNCYEFVPDCIDAESAITSMEKEVFCLSSSCSFEGCDIVCPTG